MMVDPSACSNEHRMKAEGLPLFIWTQGVAHRIGLNGTLRRKSRSHSAVLNGHMRNSFS